MKRPKKPKPVACFRLSETALALLRKMSEQMGIGRGSVVELAIRQMASSEKVRQGVK